MCVCVSVCYELRGSLQIKLHSLLIELNCFAGDVAKKMKAPCVCFVFVCLCAHEFECVGW